MKSTQQWYITMSTLACIVLALTGIVVRRESTENSTTNTNASVETSVRVGFSRQTHVESITSSIPADTTYVSAGTAANDTRAVPSGMSAETPTYLTGLYLSELTGKRYQLSQNQNELEMFECGANGRRLLVGTGRLVGRTAVLSFHSTLDEVDGVLKLEPRNDGEKLIGEFKAIDATKHGPVTLFRLS